MSAPRVGVARIPRGEADVQVRFHRHRSVLNDSTGRRRSYEQAFDVKEPDAITLDRYPGRLPSPIEPLRDPALPADPEERP